MGTDDAIESAVTAAYEIVRLTDLEEPAQRIERALGARGTLIFTYPHEAAPIFIGGSLAPRMHGGYREVHYRRDPVHAAMRRLPPRFSAHTAEPWFDREAFVRSFAYRDFYRRVGAEELGGVWLTEGRYGERDMVGIVWVGARGFVGPDFHRRMEPLRAPLRQAARRALLFDRVQRERDIVQVLLTRGASHVDVVQDRHGRTVWMSPRAQRLFPSGQPTARLREHLGGFRAHRDGRIPAALRRPVSVALGVRASVFLIRDVPHGPWSCATLESAPVGSTVEALTPAEGAVLVRMATGLTNSAIADELRVSRETVRTHVKRILRKLDVRNRTEASRRARDLGLVGDR